jgi:hypothetical protein
MADCCCHWWLQRVADIFFVPFHSFDLCSKIMEAMTISPDEDIDDMSSVDDLSDEDEA